MSVLPPLLLSKVSADETNELELCYITAFFIQSTCHYYTVLYYMFLFPRFVAEGYTGNLIVIAKKCMWIVDFMFPL
jgi:hypothetical protein